MDLNKAVKNRRSEYAAIQDYGQDATNFGDGYGYDDEAYTWPFYVGITLLLTIVVFLAMAFFAPEWLESEPQDPFDEDF